MNKSNITKLISMLVLVAMLFVTTASVSASETTDEKTLILGDTEVIICNTHNWSDEKCAKIAEAVVNNGSSQSARGLLCLFGHKMEYTTTTAITHKVYATSPRCLQSTYNVGACSRCDHTESTLISEKYIVCCPVD